jgi:hypothetical protein
MPYFDKTQIAEARQMDLYTYLRANDPFDLVRIGPGVYKLRSHDSLKISNGKWYWWSKSVGGQNAIDYLMLVKDHSFTEAVEMILGQRAYIPARKKPQKQADSGEKILILPARYRNNDLVYEYLTGRGIHRLFAAGLIHAGGIYESRNGDLVSAVFVGVDLDGVPRYAALRGIDSDYKREAKGSDKRFSFSIPAEHECSIVHVFEGAVDLLSFATLAYEAGCGVRNLHLLSLGGAAGPPKQPGAALLPQALAQYLTDHKDVSVVVLHLDNDEAGRNASAYIASVLPVNIVCKDAPPPKGKDYNNYLMLCREEESLRKDFERQVKGFAGTGNARIGEADFKTPVCRSREDEQR